MIAAKLVFAVMLLMPHLAFAADCSDLGKDDPVNDALVSNLQQQADAAEQRASMSTNKTDHDRWITTANMIRLQAQGARDRHRDLARASQQLCDAILNK